MKKLYSLVLIVFFISCNENLLEKPENLIPEDKMAKILTDLAIVNAAKSTNVAVLQDNEIEPMGYIFEKYGIDSIQFVKSDRYYASLPVAYERMYKKIEATLENKAKNIEEEKAVKDSLERIERKSKFIKADAYAPTDSLP